MADISLQHPHSLNAEQARGNIEKLAEKLADRIGGTWRWDGDTIVCESRGAVARVGYDASLIHVEVKLPRAFKPLKRRIQAKIEESFDRYFRPT